MIKKIYIFLFIVMPLHAVDVIIRKGTMDDESAIFQIYKKLSGEQKFLARTADEITENYVHEIVLNAVQTGLVLVAQVQNQVIGTMIKCKGSIKTFAHVLHGGFVIVDSDFQNQGIGRLLIASFLQEVQENRPDILRVELLSIASNPAVYLYQKCGFLEEARFAQKRLNHQGKLEDDLLLVWFNPAYCMELQ